MRIPFPTSWLLRNFPSIRRRFAHFFKASYFSELEISIPVRGNLWAPLLHYDSYDSFSEIFIHQEYDDFLPDSGPFERVLDLGAHMGYFSLWLQSIQPETPLYSLLVEADERASEAIDVLIRRNRLEERFQNIAMAVGPASEREITFHSRPFMASSAFGFESETDARKAVVSDEEIASLFSPPYDLVKIDVEGSEWAFLNDYENTLRHARSIVLEWHSWHEGGGGAAKIRERLSSLGFTIEKESETSSATGREGEVGLISATKRNEGK